MAIHTFSCIQDGTLPTGWSSELPCKRWHHQISTLVVLLLISPLNKFLNSQRGVSLSFLSRTQSSRLTLWITLLQAVDFHWRYNWSPTFILSSSKCCLLTTEANPGLTSFLPPSLQPAPDLTQFVQKKTNPATQKKTQKTPKPSAYQPSDADMDTWVLVLVREQVEIHDREEEGKWNLSFWQHLVFLSTWTAQKIPPEGPKSLAAFCKLNLLRSYANKKGVWTEM